jgi:squalene-hopene/tetraprenyl-beta-curcumene cyclase
MWAVLGLVSLDVITVDVAGVQEGEHVHEARKIHASARDNSGYSVRRIDIAVDDVTLASVCGDQVDLALDSAWLGDGAHTLDVTATNARGKTSHRRVGLYAGAYYLTELGTRFEDHGTTFALRNLAPKELENKVELHVYATRADHGDPARGSEVFVAAQTGAQGPMRFFWDGKDATGRMQPRGSYVAELRFLDSRGAIVQKLETPFVQDTLEAQAANYGEVAGALSADGKNGLGNTQVDLVDERGRIVQSTKSTAQGNYQFRNVTGGNYKVRVKKDGYVAPEAAVAAAPASTASASVKLEAK